LHVPHVASPAFEYSLSLHAVHVSSSLLEKPASHEEQNAAPSVVHASPTAGVPLVQVHAGKTFLHM
jgi:hypothetical protein